MNLIEGNIFDIAENDKYDALCITTNGIVKANGEAVMGAGIAKEAKQRYNGIDIRLGKKINENGNHVYQLGVHQSKDLFKEFKVAIISFPTKNNWKDNSNLKLIEQSAKELVQLITDKGYKKILVPQCRENNNTNRVQGYK